MAAAGRSFPDVKFVPYLLDSLGTKYDALISSIATHLEPIPSIELLSHLLAHEACMHHHSAQHQSHFL